MLIFARSDAPMPPTIAPESVCRILALDGGGAKGFYTLGVLREIEGMLGKRLHEGFDLVFGTSTGAIIAALIGLGCSVDEIHDLYKAHVPRIMSAKSAAGKSHELHQLALDVFRTRKFEEMRTRVGIVATRWVNEKPMIFKGDAAQGHGRLGTFVPGFGCTIADAVEASCSAYPFFNRKIVTTQAGDRVELVDGGYCANNPTLYAIADATRALGFEPQQIRAVSIGVGVYPEPKQPFHMRLARRYLLSLRILQKTLDINIQSMDQLREILFKHVPTVRISDTFEQPEMATDLFEHDLVKLNILRQRGAESFATREQTLRGLLL